jgi:hypothetical protein
MSKRFGSFVTPGTIAVLLAATAMIPAPLRGQVAPPATEPTVAAPATPTTAPAVPADPSTPRGALKSLYNAMQDGDGAHIRELLLTATAVETKMVDAMAHRAEAEAKFRKAAVNAFGEQKAKLLVGDSEVAGSEAMTQIDVSEEKVDGDKATVSNNSGQAPLALTRVNGKWKIPASEFAKGTDVAEIEKQLPDMEFFAGLIDGYATDVAAGKYKSAEEAGDAIKGQMMVEMMKRQNAHQPTTGETAPDGAGPTTEPTTRPGAGL